jgi:histone H2A
LTERKYGERVEIDAQVILAPVLENVTVDILELARNASRDNEKTRISPRNFMLALRNDEDLNQFLSKITITSSGVIPHIHIVLYKFKESRI